VRMYVCMYVYNMYKASDGNRNIFRIDDRLQ
jgi:hypothetical protein